MRKIITAIGNEKLNNKLRNVNDLEIKERDIFYLDGILEFLEKDSDVDIVIFNEELCTESLDVFIRKISMYQLQIYLLLNKEHYIEEFDKYPNIKTFNEEEEIIAFLENREYIPEKNNYSKIKNVKRVISIIGNSGVGKTVFCSLLGKTLAKTNKLLLINFDFFSNDLKDLFDLKKETKYYDVNSLIIKLSKNLYILNGMNYIFNEINKIDNQKVKEIIEELKNDFDYILIDTSSEVASKYIKSIFSNCDYNIFLLEPNNLEIKKSRDLLELYSLDLGLDFNKTGIFINKYNISSTDIEIIKNIFEKIKIIGKINYTPKINSYINTYTRNNIKFDDIYKFQKFLKGVK